jgi:uncharacterized membrane protein
VSPFDIKSIFLAKHAQHVVLVHFPIALFLVGVLFDWIAQWKRNASLANAAYYNLSIAAFSTLPVVGTGILAWQWQLEGSRLRGNLLLHLILGASTSLLIWLVWWFHYSTQRRGHKALPAYRLPVEALTAILVAMTGHLGGFLSGVNG